MQTTIIDAQPHPGQAAVHHAKARYKALNCGRRWGKTRLGVMECIDVATQGGRAWWVAPSYKMSEVGWRPLRRLAAQIAGAEVRRGDRQVNFAGGGSIAVRSADNPDSLRGEGLDYVVLDECAFMHEDAWREALRPALADRKGSALFISTPKGRNWFWRLWQYANSAQSDDWRAWQFTSYDNPHIDDSEIDAAREQLPDRIFRQEFMAEFIDDAGGVFRGVMAAATSERREAEDDRYYSFGVDWGKHNDFTVITVIDDTGSVVMMDRFNQIDYTVQASRLKVLAERYKPQIIVAEKNAMGEPIIERLQRDGLPVQPFNTTNASKAQAIESLSLAFERGEISILNDPDMIAELQAYEVTRLPSGLMRYNAPSGMHDDIVMSLAFAWAGVSDSGPLILW